MSPPDRKRGRDARGTGRVSVKPGTIAARTSGSRSNTSATADQGGQRFSAAVVLVFILASTAISLYDLYLLFTLLAT